MATGKIQQDVVIKVTGQKELAEAEKTIDSIDGKKATATVEVDTQGVEKGVVDVKQALEEVDGTTAEASVDVRIREALEALVDVAIEAKKSATAVDALSAALGPELTPRMDVNQVVSDFQRLNLSVEEIAANAGILGGALREIDAQNIGGNLSTNLDRARGSTENLTGSAGAARNMLSNLVGNATQDLGSLVGVSGTASTAVGTLAEGFAEAAIQGEGLGTVIASFGKVAGPIALVSAGIALITTAIARAQAEQKKIADQTKEIAEGINETFTEIDISAFGEANDLLDQLALNFVKADDKGGLFLETMTELNADSDRLGENLVRLSTEAGQLDFFKELLQSAPEFQGQTEAAAELIASAIAQGAEYEHVLRLVGVAMNLNTDFTIEQADATLAWIEQNRTLIEQMTTVADGADNFDLSDQVDSTTEALKKSKDGLAAWQQAVREVDTTGMTPDEADLAILERAFAIINDVGKATEEWAKQNRPISDMPKTWESIARIANDVRRGIELTAADQQILDNAMQAYGLTQQQVLDRGIDLWDQYGSAVEQISDVVAEQNRQIADAFQANEIAVGEFGQAIAELADAGSVAERSMSAVEDAFTLHNAPLDALEEVVAFEEGLHDLVNFLAEPKNEIAKLNEEIAELENRRAHTKVAEDIAGINDQIAELVDQRDELGKLPLIPDIFDPNDVNREEFLAKFRTLRGDVQREIQQAFSEAGGGAAGAAAGQEAGARYVEQIFQSLGGALTHEQIITLLGLDELTATLKIAIDKESLAEAQAVLAAFVELPFVDPLLAFQLQIGLMAGTITPDTVLTIINDQLKNVGAAQLPAELMPPDARSMNTARDQANAFYKLPGNAADMVSKAGTPNNIQEIIDDTQDQLDGIWVTIPTKLGTPTNINDIPWWVPHNDAGGIVSGRYGGLVAERRPEIVNGRWLITSPTIVPSGTRVTSGAKTSRILRTARHHGLRQFDSGGLVAGPSTINVNFNGVGAIGNRFDLMRTVQRANLDKLRLLGERG